MTRGFLYVANQEKFVFEAILSAKSLRRFTDLPLSIVLTEDLTDNQLNIFDEVIVNNELKKHTYLSKVIGLQYSPYDETIFLDSDTFICGYIDDLFDLLEYADFSTTIESKRHTTSNKNLLLYNIMPEFNTGVILYKSNQIMMKIFKDWFQQCIEWNIKNDMPGFREAVLQNFKEVKYSVLPDEYNLHGLKTMVVIEGDVKIIHERLGFDINSLTPHYQSLKKMDRLAKKLNRFTYKRMYLSHIGLISYRYTPSNLLFRLKKILGAKRQSKSTFIKKIR